MANTVVCHYFSAYGNITFGYCRIEGAIAFLKEQYAVFDRDRRIKTQKLLDNILLRSNIENRLYFQLN